MYGASLRSDICEVAIGRRAKGERLTTIAASLGISTSMLSEWLARRAKKVPVREVVVEVDGQSDRAEPAVAILVRLANGAVVEGLSLADIEHLLSVVK